MKKYIIFSICAIISLFIFRTAICQTTSTTSTFSHIECHHGQCPFVYFVSVQQGSLQRLKNNEYALAFHKTDITHVLSYQKNPFMLAHYTDSKCLKNDPKAWRADEAVFPDQHLLKGNIMSSDMVFPEIKIKSIKRTADGQMIYTFLSSENITQVKVGHKLALSNIVLVSNGVEQEKKLGTTWAWGGPCHA
ncbi:MAG: hypothetical protein AAGB12_16890 [Pseudomonadota bacterium]